MKKKLFLAISLVALGFTAFYPTRLPEAAAQGAKVDPVPLVVKPPQVLVDKGRELYQGSCVSCHGAAGQGDGAAAAVLTPKPRNFTVTSGWKNGPKISEMYKTMEEGLPGSAMAPYNYLPAKDRLALIHYVRTFADFPPATPQEAAEMEKKYKLSESLSQIVEKKQSIPVAVAMKQLVKENEGRLKKVDERWFHIQNHPNDPGTKLLMRLLDHPKKALLMLSASNAWKNSLADFKSVLLSNRGNNGFKPTVALLSKKDWDVLYQYLKKLHLTFPRISGQTVKQHSSAQTAQG